MHLVAGRLVCPARTSARYSLCLRRISCIRSGLVLRPRPLGATPLGHWGPIPQYLHPVCKSPPYHASQYLFRRLTSHIGLSTSSTASTAASTRPWLSSGRRTSSKCVIRGFIIYLSLVQICADKHHKNCGILSPPVVERTATFISRDYLGILKKYRIFLDVVVSTVVNFRKFGDFKKFYKICF